MKDPEMLGDGTRRPASRKSGINLNNIKTAARGEHVTKVTAEKIAGAFGKKLNEMFVEETRPDEELGIESTSIARVRKATSAIFNTALKKDIVWKNPVVHATSPRGTQKEKQFLDADDCRKLLGYLDEIENPNARVGLTTLHKENLNKKRLNHILCGILIFPVYMERSTW